MLILSTDRGGGDHVLVTWPYQEVHDPGQLPRQIALADHLDGFDPEYNNWVLDRLDRYAGEQDFAYEIFGWQPVLPAVKRRYKNLIFRFYHDAVYCNWNGLKEYDLHPPLRYRNFACSFNGSSHVSRRLLVAIMHRYGWFDPEFSTKNFVFGTDVLDGHLQEYGPDYNVLHHKIFIGAGAEDFFQTKYTMDYNDHGRYEHVTNLSRLETALTGSFLHLVSETMATSHNPCITEKFLYSICTRGLFVTYGQPGWHRYIQQYFGFKLYDKIFDYGFDTISNPVHRLVQLVSMLSRFRPMSALDWHDLYLLELPNIEFNLDHFRSGRYQDHAASHAD